MGKKLALAFFSFLLFICIGIQASANESIAPAEPSVQSVGEYGTQKETWDISAGTAGTVTATLYSVSDTEDVLVISGTGKMKDWGSYDSVPWFNSYRPNLKSVIIKEGVTNIGDYAFYFCTKLERVEISSTVKTIGGVAFYYCSRLTEVTLPDSVTTVFESAFAYCKALKTLNLGAVKRINYTAFEGCEALTALTLPKELESIGACAFLNCTALANISVEEGNNHFSSFDGDLYSFDGKTLINYAIGKRAYSYTAKSGVKTVSDYAFYSSKLFSVTLGEGVESVGSYAFGKSANLRRVTLGDSVTAIGTWAFSDCTSLSGITLGSLTEIAAYAFYNATSLKSVTLPATVKKIGTSAFFSCKGLQTLNLGSVEQVADYAFWKCVSLENLSLGTSLEALGVGAFRDCTALTEIKLPQSLNTVGAYAFGGCTALKTAWIFSPALLSSFVSDTDCGSIGKYAVSICIPSSFVTDGTYVASFPQKTAIIKDGPMLLFSSCNHEWLKLKSGDYICSSCLVTRTALDIVGVSVGLGYDLSLSVYVDTAFDPSILFVMEDLSQSPIATYDDSLGLLRYTFLGITPQRMGDLINASLIFDGVTYDSLTDYSVKEYCTHLLSLDKTELGMTDKEYTALRTLVADLLHYGAAAQTYTGYKTDSLVNRGIEQARAFTAPESTDFSLTEIAPSADAYFTAVNLRFDNTNMLYFKLYAKDISRVSVSVDYGKGAVVYTADDFTENNGVYSIITDGIYFSEFDKIYTATLLLDGEAVEILKYSVNSYVFEKYNSQNARLSALVKALYNYGESAKAFSLL